MHEAEDHSEDHRPDRAYARAVGERLRAIRIQAGLSLNGVEARSGGRWKTAAVGSYERGDRMISWAQLHELAAFYGVPTGAPLPGGGETSPTGDAGGIVLDVWKLLARASAATAPPAVRLLAEWVKEVATVGVGAHDAEQLPLREEHEAFLAVLAERAGVERGKLRELLAEAGVLAAPAADRGEDGETSGG